MVKTSARTAKILRERGLDVGISERWIPFQKPKSNSPRGKKRLTGVRQDLFGVADLVAFGPTYVWLVQSCAGSGIAAHLETIRKSKVAERWLEAPYRGVMVMAWRKTMIKKYGASPKKALWIYKEIQLIRGFTILIDTDWRRP